MGMNKIGLLLIGAALLTGCAATPTTPAAPAPTTTATAAVKPSLPTLTSAQLSDLTAKLRDVDPAAAQGGFDKAQAVCLQIADGAHGPGFLRGVETRFGTAPGTGQSVVDAVKSAGVCG